MSPQTQDKHLTDQLLATMDWATLFAQSEIAPEAALGILDGLAQADPFSDIDRRTASYQATVIRSQLPFSYEQMVRQLEKDIKELESDPEQAVALADAFVTWAKMAITLAQSRDIGKLRRRLQRAKEIFAKNNRQRELLQIYALLTAVDIFDGEYEEAERHGKKAVRFFHTYGPGIMSPAGASTQDIILRSSAN